MDGKTTTGKVLNYQLCKSRIVFNVNYKSIRDNRRAKRIYYIRMREKHVARIYPNCYEM